MVTWVLIVQKEIRLPNALLVALDFTFLCLRQVGNLMPSNHEPGFRYTDTVVVALKMGNCFGDGV